MGKWVYNEVGDVVYDNSRRSRARPITGPRRRKIISASVKPPLRRGSENPKMGGSIFERGPCAGALSFWVALCEGWTCPDACRWKKNGHCSADNYQGCRWLVDEHFFPAVRNQLQQVLKTEQDRAAVRLHVSGDFPDVAYVSTWVDLMAELPGLFLWGHTHHRGEMWNSINSKLNDQFAERCLIRLSDDDASEARWSANVIHVDDVRYRRAGQAVCPATLTKRVSARLQVARKGDPRLSVCSKCGLCLDRRVPEIAWPMTINGVGHVEDDYNLILND